MGDSKEEKMKSAYAVTFLGLCALALLVHVHVNESTDDIREEYTKDPFLATLEARVVARAQARLHKRNAAVATKKHISSVRQQIRDSLKKANDIAMADVEEDQLATMASDAAAMGLKAGLTKKTKKKAKKDPWLSQHSATTSSHGLS